MATSPLRNSVWPKLKPILKPLYHGSFRSQLRVRCLLNDLLRFVPNRAHAIPPAMIRFRVGESIDVDDFLRVGKGCADLIQQHLHELGTDFAPGMKILDFGCGCGRVLRWLKMRAPYTAFYGADVDGEAIRWCAQNLKPAQFEVSTPHPPLSYPDAYFDIIYCISVFTHLDEEMQDPWFRELGRILKPGGTLLFTVHGAAAALGLDPEERNTLETNGFLFHRSRKLHGILPSWYHTAWHTERYIVKRASQWFPKVEYRSVPDSGQDIIRCQS